MKNFFQFLTEAKESQASMQARKLNLKSDGHGGWLDSRGEFVAKTEKGKLVFYDRGRVEGAKDRPKGAVGKSPAPEKTEAKPKAEPAPAPKAPAKAAPPTDDVDTGSDTLTVAFGRFNPPTVGHEKLLKVARKAATGGDLKIYPSSDAAVNTLKIDFISSSLIMFSSKSVNIFLMYEIFISGSNGFFFGACVIGG
jgi:hypothetical protein